MWRSGCIIRSAFLGQISKAFQEDPGLSNLILAPYFRNALEESLEGWRQVCSAAVLSGIPVPAMTSALSYFDGYRCANLPANLLQAQRDYFGAHTYERVDRPRGEYFHTNWTGRGEGNGIDHIYCLRHDKVNIMVNGNAYKWPKNIRIMSRI